MSYYSKDVTVPEGEVPSSAMECQTLLKLYNSRKSKPLDLKYRCDICRTYFAQSKWFILTHKAVEHKIPIPMDYRG